MFSVPSIQRASFRAASWFRPTLVSTTNHRYFSQLPAGQPTPESHPHILSTGELTPGISSQEYADRRIQLIQRLPSNHALVLVSASQDYWSHDVPGPFRQDADFGYITGFQEPNSVAVLTKIDDSPQLWMFVQPRDPSKELWTGLRSGIEGAMQRFNADGAYSIDQLENKLIDTLPEGTRAVIVQSNANHLDRNLLERVHRVCSRGQIPKLVSSSQNGSDNDASSVDEEHHNTTQMQLLKSAEAEIEKMRARKSESEIVLMRKACHLSCEAHVKAIEYVARKKFHGDAINECGIASTFKEHIESQGGRLAYPSVVAGGSNALILHYVENRQVLNEHDMVLLDGGAQLNYYSGDITRTWPISGTYSRAQSMLYDVVLECQTTLINELRDGSCNSLLELHRRSVDLLKDGLQQLGIVGDISVGHYLGMDVHDTPSVASSAELLPGSIITLEPAVYIPLHDSDVPPEFRGIGIRTEDNILISENGAIENLTSDAPKTMQEIEETFAAAMTTKVYLD